MFDLSRYSELKAKNLVHVSKIGDAFVVAWKTFDPMTGEEKKPQVEAFDLDSIAKTKTRHDELSRAAEELLKDLVKL